MAEQKIRWEYQIISEDRESAFNKRLKEMVKEGWYPKGELMVKLTSTNHFNHVVYSMLMIKDNGPDESLPTDKRYQRLQ